MEPKLTLSAGTRLGPYEVVSPLGAGGMGEVWRARDTRLGRELAVKVLPEEFSRDPERLRRFEQEARSTSALSDPHIVTVFDVGEANGIHYFASELVEGTDLRQLLEDGPPPLKKALDLAGQIASGLAAAHEKGIVHRDLKPENILITKSGLVKIADFGLAKLVESKASQISRLPTSDAHQTTDGVILGTVAYMSPEQARGGSVDFRSDQFSLGVVLHEMLTGKRPFQGTSATEMLAAIIRDEPELVTKFDPKVPALVGWLVQRCLAKDPEDRYSSTLDLAKELRGLRLHLSEAVGAADVKVGELPRIRRRVSVRVLLAVVALATLLGPLLVIRLLRTGSPPAPSLSLTLSFPIDAAPDTYNTNPVALSPDGKTLVYAGLRGGRRQLFVRSLDREEIRPIAGTDGASFPFFSPDGRWVGFFAEKKLKKVALAGGSPITLCDAPRTRGGSWGRDDTIVFVPASGIGLQRIPASGGEPKSVTRPDPVRGLRHAYVQILPDGENVLFMVNHSQRLFRAAVVSLRTGEQRTILEDAADPRYVPTGHLVFNRRGVLYAAPFDLRRLQTTGPPVPLLEDILTNRNLLACAEFSHSEDGTLVYVPYRQPQRSLVWVDRKGAVEVVPFQPAGYQRVALSPDGGLLAAISTGKAEEMSLLFGDFGRRTLTRSRAEGGFGSVVWAPDGTRVAFGFAPEEKKMSGLFWQSADGVAPVQRLGVETVIQMQDPASFSPDGSALLFQALNYTYTSAADARWETFVLPLSSDGKPQPFLQTRFNVEDARFSPDGRWVAYKSDESGRWEIYVQPYPGPGPRWQISSEGGEEPRWSRNGRELFFKQGDSMMAADVELKPAFRAGKPRALFEGRYFSSTGFGSYDVAPDASRFLMIKPDPEESGPAHVKVALNWFAEVKRRAPGGR